jgi:DNA-binding NarL/FixJ family response regulator
MDHLIRCLLIGATDSTWQAFKAALADTERITIVGEAYNSLDALRCAISPQPDVILLSTQTLHLDTLHIIQQMKIKFPESKMIILSPIRDRQWVLEALREGAWGILDRECMQVDDIIRAIRTVSEGGVVLGPQVAGWMLDEIVQGQTK